jgi:NAD(P)-dependent dehydrogenase (short-subunit alcohol dehydrogenase family)
MWGPFLEVDESTWDAVADLNLKGSYFGAQAAARQMIAQQAADLVDGSGGSAGSFGGSAGSFGGSAGSFGGRIIFSSSVTGSVALPNCSAYAVTKAGLFHMARVLGLELGRHAITVNALGIGATVNERNLRDDPAYEAHWAGVNPTGRCGRPEDVASALLYLTDPAAHMINGHTLLIDGGWSTIGAVP